MSEQRTYLRFPLARRIEHVIMLVSFSMLAFTGLPQKFPTWGISQALVGLFGGIETTRLIHHGAAVVLMLGTIWHILVAGYKMYVERTPLSMLPLLKDGKDAWQAFSYNLGVGKSRPQMGRYSFEEKMEYWAFAWGAVVMGMTGFMMWNPISTAQFFPGQAIPAAKAAHGAEAILAVLAIIIWHFYGVHLKLFNKAMWTGRMSEEEMLHEHPLELADIKAGLVSQTVDPAVKRKRQMVYFPIAAVLALIMLGGVYGFINIESTVVTEIPPVSTVTVFVPQTPTPLPTAAPAPTAQAVAPGSLTWDAYAAPVFKTRCETCHGAARFGGLSLQTYADALAGGNNGAVIIPGDSAGSPLIAIQTAGGHAGQLSPEELAAIKEWIDAGASEK
jgi:cytochrome b subunit of formate dehydrogenase